MSNLLAPPPAATTHTSSGLSLDRRTLLAGGALGAGLAAMPLSAQGAARGFTHGIASGEPHANGVLLWTRFVGSNEAKLAWEVSDSAQFTRVVAEGETLAAPGSDWCAKAQVTGLEPNRWYYYRFTGPDGSRSAIGRTRTLPVGPTSRYRLGVFSCSNMGFGYFNAYAHAAEANEFDLLLHLGDYLYEYQVGKYPEMDQIVEGRAIAPTSEIVQLADYRLRHATYRMDPDLQRLTQLYPMILIPDDHESANDSWTGGAENHQSATEGSWDARKGAAMRAYREWLPVSDDPWKAYQLGDLATLFRLETRLTGRDEQLNVASVLAGKSTPDEMMAALTAFRDGAWADPSRHMLGAAQEAWLAGQLRASTRNGTRWQVLVQQVLMGSLSTPTAFADALPANAPEALRQRVVAGAMATRAGLPLNMDAWDGYPAARARVFEAALAADANLVVLAGDTHNAWGFDLAHDGRAVGVEFGVSSVTSPGFEGYIAQVPPALMQAALVGANPQLQWADTAQRGYMALELTPQAATCEWRFMSGVRQRGTQLAGTHRMTSALGSGTLAKG
ncbi:alkaline phosphatase D family protein [Alteriqipengyuania lutimaris]|uniref:Alkaline phosphatase n=1 Tax=Alteriqipengyuania lutimaris TaxID=1538146 RepID=A0A395LJC4_9SPHN|nr:alkaline phosphatase D family protein [Alteriqipengyuania lutimaris]MBB3034221.1 alkaline phosphatase D [Alteriqipengyuania lutimaris]RDS76861.1 alkaline phosphatase [Alteriqipengyuania lutimaris]